jgi:hypothetical protein
MTGTGAFDFCGFGVADCATPHGSCGVQPAEQFLILSGPEEFPRESPQFSPAESRESSSRNPCRGQVREYLKALRPSERFGIEEGSLVTSEEREDGILIRPAAIVPVEKYTPARKADIPSNATSDADYRRARKEVQQLGLNPDSIPHRRPA